MQCLPKYTGTLITIEGRATLDREIKELCQRAAALKQTNPNWADAVNVQSVGIGVIPTTIDLDLGNLESRIRDKIARRDQAHTVPNTTLRDQLRITNVCSLMYQTRAGRTYMYDVRRFYKIVGFGEGDCDSKPRRIAYDSELAEVFLGQSVGFNAWVKMDGRIRKVTLSAIYLETDAFIQKKFALGS